jgi:heat shock protein HslJ
MRVLIFAAVAAVAAACATPAPTAPTGRGTDPQAVVGQTWQWEATITPVEKISVPNPENYTIRLTEAGKVEARFDCNRGGGTYEISRGSVQFGPLRSTRMVCAPESLDGLFVRDLGRVTTFFVEDGTLYLELAPDAGTMRFRPAP